MTGLKTLDLDPNQIDPEYLCLLTANEQLEALRLFDNPLAKNSDGLKCLKALKSLRSLLLQGTDDNKLRDDDIVHLKGLSGLKSLSIHNNYLTDKALSETICHIDSL